jgi:hypothetical protein
MQAQRTNPFENSVSNQCLIFARDDRTIADWGQITNYFSQLDKASDRILVQSLGQST